MSSGPRHPSGSRNYLDVSPEDTLKSPKPGLNLYLNRPLNGNASNVSVNEVHPPHTPLGLRAQLGNLLPRHTFFRARVTIHQISSVPFVSGEFGVRWKFKGVQTPTGQKQGLLDRVKARAEKRTVSDKGKAREDAGSGRASNDRPLTPTEDGHVGVRKEVGGRSASGPTSVPMKRSGTSSSHASSVSSRSSHAEHSQHLSVGWGTNSSSASTNSSSITVALTPSSMTSDLSTITNTPSLVNASLTQARGMTPYLKLKEHSVIWSHTLDTVLKFDVDRESSQLSPNPLKLVVLQRVIPDDPRGSPQNPRLGALYLNLAEYVGQGSVERRYLLKESKTNATLKVTIEMEYMSGETHYIPPPLAKGEILTGIAGFLEKDAVKKRPRGLDIYGPYSDQQELELDLLGAAKSARIPRTARSTRRPSDKSTPPDSDSEDADESIEEVGVAFDVQRLPLAYGTKTTEALIDALFNPVKTTEKRDESPFTIYEPPSPGITPTANSHKTPKPENNIGLGLSGIATDRNATIVPRRQGSMASSHGESSSASVYSTSSGSASVRTTTSESSKSRLRDNSGSGQSDSQHGHVNFAVSRGTPEGRIVVGPAAAEELQIGGVRAWWRRHTRPATPTQKA